MNPPPASPPSQPTPPAAPAGPAPDMFFNGAVSFRDTRCPILVTCAKGVPPFLADEVRRLDFPILSELPAGVLTEGTLADTMRLNLHLRTAQRVMFQVAEFKASHPDELYAHLNGYPWEAIIDAQGYVCVASAVADVPGIRDTRFVNVKCKDAIVDRIRDRCGRRPDSGSDRGRSVVFCYWQGSLCRIYLDTSGEALARRGYRMVPVEAPMQESLGAAVVLATGWQGQSHFINPMCGSGTLGIEAALIALNRAPGLLRSNFGFMHLKGFRAADWNMLRREAQRQARRTWPGRMVLSDINPHALDAARRNARTAEVDHLFDFRVCDFAATPLPQGTGLVMLNPEYGERTGRADQLEETYRRIGDFFKQRCLGYAAFVFTGNLDLAKRVGLRTCRRILFYNGDIECRLLEYELYTGTRRRFGAEARGTSDAKPPAPPPRPGRR